MQQYEQATADEIANKIKGDAAFDTELTRRITQHIRYRMRYNDMSLDQYRQELAVHGETGIAREIQGVVREFAYECVALRLNNENAVPYEGQEAVMFEENTMGSLIIDMFDFRNTGLWSDIAKRWVPGISDYARDIGETA